jgi:hypothetical protein
VILQIAGYLDRRWLFRVRRRGSAQERQRTDRRDYREQGSDDPLAIQRTDSLLGVAELRQDVAVGQVSR